MQVLTLVEIQDLFFDVTKAITGYNDNLIRHANKDSGQPAWEIGQNLAVLNVEEVDDPYNKQRDIAYFGIEDNEADAEEKIKYTRVYQVTWNMYGPLSSNMADRIRMAVLTEAIRSLLAVEQVYPITDISNPIRVPYLFNSQWWEYSKVVVKFNVTTIYDGLTPYLTSGEVFIGDSGGPSRVLVVPIEES